MNPIKDLFKGIVIGIANIIPGVSGGTMAVSLGVYDRIIYALTDIIRNFRKAIWNLLPLLVGMAVGIIGFTYAIEFLLGHFALPTCMTFIGLILGCIPMLWRNLSRSRKEQSSNPYVCLLIFLVMFAVSGFMPMLKGVPDTGSAAIPLPIWFFIGVIASATMVIPGVSGSMVLIVLGYYYTVISRLKAFFEALRALDIALAFQLAVPLFFFGIGVLLGIFLIAKAIRWLFERVPMLTYSAILGLVAAAPIAMLYNTGALYDLQMPSGAMRAGIGAVLLGIAFIVIYLPDRKSLSSP